MMFINANPLEKDAVVHHAFRRPLNSTGNCPFSRSLSISAIRSTFRRESNSYIS